MATALRKTGISVVGDMPWGTHFCYFYETKQDLLDILVPYFKAGLESKEFCLWIISNSELITLQEAKEAVGYNLDRSLAEGGMEIVSHDQWFLKNGAFDLHTVARGFKEKLDEALASGYAGLRVNGSPAWLESRNPKELREFEEEVDHLFANEHIIASCTYPLEESRADFLLDVARNHQFLIAKRQGNWEVLETPQLMQAKQEIQRLNEELEQRVIERTTDLAAANEELRKEIAERKRAEDALRHSEERLRLIIDTVPALIHTGLPDGQLDFFNQRWLDFVGLSLEDLSGWKWTAAIHPEDVAAMVERWRAALATGEPYEHEARVRRADGEYRWMVHSEVPLRDERGNIVKWYASSIDITERKRAEEALRKSEKLFTAFMDHLPGYAWIKDVEGRYVYINETFLQFRNAVGKTDAELWPAEIASTYRANDNQVIQTKNALQTIEPFPKDPEQGCQIVSKFPILDQDGAVVMVGGASVDITERIEAEEAVRRSEEHLRLVIDTIPTMAWSLLPDGVVDFLNQPWMDYTGLSLEEYVKDPTGPIHPEDIPRVIEKWLAQKVVGEGYEEEMRLRRADGEYRWFLVRTAPLHDESGKIIKWYGVSTDIDDRKRAEEQLKVTSEHLRALSARLSSAREDEGSRIARELHDELGAALTSLKWDLEGMSKRLTEPINQKDHSVLCEKIQEMMGLVDDILSNVRRISSELRPSILDDLGLVAAIEWQAKQVESRSGIVCKVDSLVDDLQLNREQSTAIFRILQEALTNILRHAQATRVNILIDEVDGELVLEVRDNGRGITEDEIAGSLSLGLIGMQERAQLLGGRIEIIGIAGTGTVLTLRVPIRPGASD